MSVLFMDSFDHYDTIRLDEKGTTEALGTIGPGGRCDSNCYANETLGSGITYGIQNTSEFAQVGVALNPGALSIDTEFLYICDPKGFSTPLAFLRFRTTGALEIWSGPNVISGTLQASTGAGTLQVQQYRYVEFQCRFHDSAGHLRLFLDGVQVAAVESTDTIPAAAGAYIPEPPWASCVLIPGGPGVCFDDLYMMNGDGAAPTNAQQALGNVRVAALTPQTTAEAAGTFQNWTPVGTADHGGAVNEIPPDDDTTYLQSATDNAIETLQFRNLGFASDVVYGLQVSIYGTKTKMGNHDVTAVTRGPSGGVNAGTPFGVSARDYFYYAAPFPTNPDTGIAWTLPQVNAAQFGMRLTVP